MEYKAYYIYNNKKTPILIKNDSVNLSFKMEGIEFSGSEFSDFSTKDEISDKIKDEFEFWEISILGQDKVQRTLCDCSFNIFVPQMIIASESQNEFECVLTINYILGKERPKPKGGLEEERVDLSIIVNGQEYKGSGDFFEVAVLLNLSTLYQSITKSEFKEGNDLVTVLSTMVCVVLHIIDNSFQRYKRTLNFDSKLSFLYFSCIFL